MYGFQFWQTIILYLFFYPREKNSLTSLETILFV